MAWGKDKNGREPRPLPPVPFEQARPDQFSQKHIREMEDLAREMMMNGKSGERPHDVEPQETIYGNFNIQNNGHEEWDVGPNGERLNIRPYHRHFPLAVEGDKPPSLKTHIPPTHDIKRMVKDLTYGEMIEFVELIVAALPESAVLQAAGLSQEQIKTELAAILPGTLHRMATSA